MPSLTWIGREAVERHHSAVPFHLLHADPLRSAGEVDSGNLLVEGDNLVALKALLPYYAGQVKCICIDPPYNTGEQTWTYNDKVNSPIISKWLGETVGRETDDLSRHDKWLCMMYPRLQLLLKFLSPDGFLFICIDDVELFRLKLLMDEMLPPNQFVGTFIWKSRRNLDSRHKVNISVDHEYVLAYRGPEARLRGAKKDLDKYSNPDNDPRGAWMSDNLVGLATKDRRPNLHYDLIDPQTKINYGCPKKGWRYSPETIAKKIAENRIIWPKLPTGRPRHKKFLADLDSDFTGFSSIIECGNTNEGTEEVARIFGEPQFIFPKPRSLIQTLIEQATDANSLILDSFAGSGTTGHATLDLNKQAGGNRRFILVEMEPAIATPITAERLTRVITGYGKTAGLGGGFQYCTLGQTLFDAAGRIRPEVSFAELARFVYFHATGVALAQDADVTSPRLGVHHDTAVYLLYNGILKDKSAGGGNALTRQVLAGLPAHAGPKLIYGVRSLLGADRLRREGVTFRHIPTDLQL